MFTHGCVYTQKYPCTEAFTQSRTSLYTQRLLQREVFYTEKSLSGGAFTQRSPYTNGNFTQKLLHTDAFTHRMFYTQKRLRRAETEQLLHRSFYTKKPLHREVFTHRGFCTRKLLHTEAEAFTDQRESFFTEQPYTAELLRTDGLHRQVFTQRSFCTQRFYKQKTFTHRTEELCTQKLLHAEASALESLYTEELLHTQKLLHTDVFTQ